MALLCEALKAFESKLSDQTSKCWKPVDFEKKTICFGKNKMILPKQSLQNE